MPKEQSTNDLFDSIATLEQQSRSLGVCFSRIDDFPKLKESTNQVHGEDEIVRIVYEGMTANQSVLINEDIELFAPEPLN